MQDLKRHEIFEIEALEKLKNGNFLKDLVFGGGTMLRLCHDLNRYSVDLDFWFTKELDPDAYFKKLKTYIGGLYKLTDATMKFYTLLLELKSPSYPMLLKIEIRKGLKNYDSEEKIAFSKYGTRQVILNVLTLEQMMKNKIAAAIDRKEIRDFFDIEFLLRRGVALEATDKQRLDLKKISAGFKDKDYKVTLGSLLDSETRSYYTKNKFSYLEGKLK